MLYEYQQKRDFERTPEPPPKGRAPSEGPLIFVIQKHNARRLHYDFRLEVDGVLKSWPIPKGPSLDPKGRRLAMMVEDHPLEYASFEGVIPRGEYGAGEVIVWDAGTYSPEEDGQLWFHDRGEAERRVREGLEAGKLSLFLRGQKLKGSWALVRTRRGENQWLLIKHRDAFATSDEDVLTRERSVLSGLTIEDLKAGHMPPRGQRLIVRPQDAAGARQAPLRLAVKPMLATLAEGPFSAPGWFFEPKLDGVRAIAIVADGRVRLLSRRGLDMAAQYPSLAGELAQQPAGSLVFDGEIVALDERGVPSFHLLQQRLGLTRPADIQRAESAIPVVYYVFDLLYAEGWDLCAAPLWQRKALLSALLAPRNGVRLLEHFEEDGEEAYEAAVALGFEGVVAKRKDSLYEAGRRSRAWLKVKKTLEDEFVIGGYSAGAGSRAGSFGALLLGYYEDGRLTYAGHVGAGFDDSALASLRQRLDRLRAEECPFAEEPPLNAPTTWVRPKLVARVRFAQWTPDGRLRSPVFVGLREDKAPAEVRREAPAPPPPGAVHSLPAQTVHGVLEQLARPAGELALRVEGYEISLTNLDKEMWPALDGRPALTKRDLLAYLARVSPYILSHLRNRPLTLARYPDGIRGEGFYQKHWDAPLPEFVATVRLWSDSNAGDGDYLMCNNLPTLLWLGQMGTLELHTWYSRIDPEPDGYHLSLEFAGSEEKIRGSLLNYPDFIVFDLDPYVAQPGEPGASRKAFAKTCEVALYLKELLDSLSLSSFLKTSGRAGLHVYVPIQRRLDYDAARAVAETLGRFLVRAHPRDVTMEWTVAKRRGKVFYDHNQNARGKTLASVYSPRATPEASVSMPLRWDELANAHPADFTIVTAPARLEDAGDLWARILEEKHDLAGLLAEPASPSLEAADQGALG